MPSLGAPIEIDRLTKHYGATAAVQDLTFTVEPGRVTGFLGPNGAGKTTTMRCLVGLVAPTAGTARIGGRHYADLDQPARRVGTLIDGAEFHPARTGRNGLRVLAAAIGVPDPRVDEALGLVGLTEAADRKVGGYSLGMRQRLGLAAALLGDPEVLVLDEPANGLDPEGVRWIREFLRYLADEGRTVFVSSHLLAEVSRLADEVVVIRRGRLVAQSPVAALTVEDGALVRSPDGARLAELLVGAGGTVAADDGALMVTGLTAEVVGEIAAREQVVLHELRHREADLESVFLELTADEEVPA